MRKYLILFILVFTGLQALADDIVITVSDLTWGENNELEVSMNNAVEVNGLQMDLILPDGFSFVEDKGGNVEPVVTERLKGLTIMCRKLPSGKYRIVAFSMSGKKVGQNEGIILRIPLKETESVSKGKYEVRVFNASASVTVDGKMEGIKMSPSSSCIVVK